MPLNRPSSTPETRPQIKEQEFNPAREQLLGATPTAALKEAISAVQKSTEAVRSAVTASLNTLKGQIPEQYFQQLQDSVSDPQGFSSVARDLNREALLTGDQLARETGLAVNSLAAALRAA